MQRHLAVAVSLLVPFQLTAAEPAPAPAPAQAAFTCTEGEVLAGNPLNKNPADRPTEGLGIKQDPPLPWRGILVKDKLLYATAVQDLWVTDMAAAAPVLKRVAGQEQKGQQLITGPCKSARFANIFGITMLSDGSLVGADQTANAIIKITGPATEKCSVSVLAGTEKDHPTVSPGSPPNQGDVDGPGAKARFRLPLWPATLNDTVYFIDGGNRKLKAVANDAAHTVTTVAKLPEVTYHGLVPLQGKLYLLASDTMSNGLLLEISVDGKIVELVKGRTDKWGGASGSSIAISGITTDGKGLIVMNAGVVNYVTVDGKVTQVAGTGHYFGGYKGNYDPTKPHKASELQLITMRRDLTAGTSVFLAYSDGALYVSALASNAHVLKIACQ